MPCGSDTHFPRLPPDSTEHFSAEVGQNLSDLAGEATGAGIS